MLSTEEKQFVLNCSSFEDYENIDEYIADIQKYLVLSDWHYTEKQAAKSVEDDMEYVKDCFEREEPADIVAVNIGYVCG